MARHAISWFTVLCGLSLYAMPVVHADKLNDFKEAASKDGCEAVPYSDMQSSCRSSMKDVVHWCDGYKGPVRCDIGITETLVARIESEKKNIVVAQERRRELVDKRDRAVSSRRKAELGAELEALDKDIEAANKRIDDAKSALDKQKYTLQMTMDTITKCIDSRTAVARGVGDAREKAGGESDPDLTGYASSIRDTLASFKSRQESAVERLNNALKTCKKGFP